MIVVDASVMVEALLDDGPIGRAARATLTADPHWAAPTHMLIEVVAVIRAKALGGKVSPARAQEAVGALSSLVLDNVDTVHLIDRIWQLRANVTAYDAAYIAAAELLACPLATGDARLAKATGPTCEFTLIVPREW
jgi:predicted nucleic acid-binding protein